MFLAIQDRIAYTDPWQATLRDRLIMLARRERRVAYFYDTPDTSTFRYRVFNMVEALNSASELGISASWFCRADLEVTNRFIDEADVLVICRTRYSAAIARMIARAKARQIPIYFDVDDLIFDCHYIHLIIDSLDQDTEAESTWNWWFSYVGRIGETLRMCDGAIATNEFLADRIKAFAGGLPVSVIPNFLNRRQHEHSETIFTEKWLSHRDERIHIGYFSGTPSHNRDFEIAAPALRRLLQEDDRIHIRVVGFAGSKARMIGHPERFESIPLQDFLNLQQVISEVEINIAPLQNTIFSNCKSELKYFEAALVGTVTVATPTFTFKRAIRDGATGLLACAQEWETKLRAAIAIVEDSERYRSMVETARREVEAQYAWNRQSSCIEAALFSQTSRVGPNQPRARAACTTS